MKWMIPAVLSLVLLLACGKGRVDEMGREYAAMNQKIKAERKAVQSDSAYQQWKKDARSAREQFLDKYNSAGNAAGIELWRSRVLIDLGENDSALVKLERIIGGNGDLADEAKFEKVRILQDNGDFTQALTLFRELKSDIPPSAEYYEILANFAWEAESAADREEFSHKFLAADSLPKNLKRYVSYMYENLSAIARERGDLPAAKKILQDAIGKLRADSLDVKSLEMTLKKVEMIGQPAPALRAPTWTNSRPLNLKKLRGKVVLIDFWAPWCSPCRAVIPTLVEQYNQLKKEGLLVIGYTRLYGSYRDDMQRLGKVPPAEEIRLINEFVKRFEIKYPIAIGKNLEYFDAYSVYGIPTLFFIGKDGKIADFKVGSGNEKLVVERIRQLLEI